MIPTLQPGDRIILQTVSSEVFEGTVTKSSTKFISLHNIYCQHLDLHYESNMIFYAKEIVSVAHMTKDLPRGPSSSPQEKKKIKMDPEEFNRLKEMYLKFEFIERHDAKFREAVEVLSNRESVAVLGLGSTFTRNPLSLLVMADFKQIYIFDMKCLVELRNLRDVLESDYIMKIVHGGEALFDCLYHKYEVKMTNVFDTQVVDSVMGMQENNISVKRNISECLNYHFNFPLALLSAAVDDMHDKTWVDRPVTKSDKTKAAQLVAYLITLRDHLLSKILQEFSDKTHAIYDKYKNINNIVLQGRGKTFNKK